MVDDQRVPMKTLKGKRRITIQMDDDFFDHLHQLAWKNHVSPTYLAYLGVIKLLLEDKKGEFSLVPEFQKDREIPRA